MLTILRGWGRFTVNGWSDAVEDAKFEFYGSNYPYVHVGVPIIALFYFDHLAWAGSVHGQRVVGRGRGCDIWILRAKLPLGPSWRPHNRIISFWPFCVGGDGPRSTGGPTRSRMRDLNFTGQITPWNQFVCGWRLEFKAKQLCDSWYYVELSAAIPPLHFFV